MPGFPFTSFDGKLAIISGAANFGIGWGIAKHCASLGMKVVIMDLLASATNNAIDVLRKEHPGVDALGVVCDVTSVDDMQSSVRTIQCAFPGVAIGALFCNAGVIFNKSVIESSLDEWSTTLQVNVFGVVNMVKAYLPVMLEQTEPCVIVNTASVSGLVRGDIRGSMYQASKHAVVALTESLSGELCSRAPHIQVHVLCPCIVASNLGGTSQVSKKVKAGKLADSAASDPGAGAALLPLMKLAMTPEAHAVQVFEFIERGAFYMITDNKRPYVDHDFPFGVNEIMDMRMADLHSRKLDNTRQMKNGTTMLSGPMFQEIARRTKAARGSKL